MANTKASANRAKKAVDWIAIEKDYRAGIKSNRQIAVEHSITEGAVRKKAKEFDWKKDLTASIKLRALELVRAQEVRAEVRASIDDAQIVEDNAQLQANVIRAHRKDIGRYSALCQSLLHEIETQTGNIVTFDEFGEMMFSPDDKGQDKRNELYHKIISNPSRVDSVKKLVDTLKTLIALEREAFSIDDKSKVQETIEDFLSKLE